MTPFQADIMVESNNSPTAAMMANIYRQEAKEIRELHDEEA